MDLPILPKPKNFNLENEVRIAKFNLEFSINALVYVHQQQLKADCKTMRRSLGQIIRWK